MKEVVVSALPGLPEITPGTDLAREITGAATRCGWSFRDGDILVIAQKVVSKAEGRITPIDTVQPSERARDLAEQLDADPRKIEVILRDTRSIVRLRPATDVDTGLLIVETLSGHICANAGVDESNSGGEGLLISLPLDPDRSARVISENLQALLGVDMGIVISDTFGRPWRLGETNIAIGQARVPAIIDLRGSRDRDGRELKASRTAFADELATASGLVSLKAGGFPVTLIRGLEWQPGEHSSRELIRPNRENLFS